MGECGGYPNLLMPASYLELPASELQERLADLGGRGMDGGGEIERAVLELDTPHPRSGRIYPREGWERAAERYQKLIDKGWSYGPTGVGLSEVSFLITKMWLEGSTVKVRLRTFNTHPGRALFHRLQAGKAELAPSGHGSVVDNTVRDYILKGFDIAEVGDASVEGSS